MTPRKICPACGIEFEGPHGNRKYCSKRCVNKVRTRKPGAQRAVNSEQRRVYWLKYRYGLTQEQYDEILLRQDGGCAICSKSPQESKNKLAVDHDHITGAIRGILCSYCNHRVVGRHRDSGVLRRVADYLDQSTGWFVPVRNKRRRKK